MECTPLLHSQRQPGTPLPQHSTCLALGLGIRGFIIGDFSLFATRLKEVDFLDDLLILSKILAERVEFTDVAGSLELTTT